MESPLVLIVEDDHSTRLMYREFLNEAGFRTADAHNGFQALEKARELRPDLVITDLAVPGMDGFALCRAAGVVNDPEYPDPRHHRAHGVPRRSRALSTRGDLACAGQAL